MTPNPAGIAAALVVVFAAVAAFELGVAFIVRTRREAAGDRDD